MRFSMLIAAFLLLTVGLAALLDLQRRHDLGRYASSPQELEIPVGSRRIAGGRAVIDALASEADRAEVRIACRGQAERHRLELGVTGPVVCGVTPTLLDVIEPPADTNEEPFRLILRVAWDDPPAGDAVPPPAVPRPQEP